MELIPPQKQKVWKWPAATNFTLGGIGTGFYLVSLLITLSQDGNWFQSFSLSDFNWLVPFLVAGAFKLTGIGLVGLGFLALTTEAGRPQRGINLFRHWRRSWMSRETIAFTLFALFAGLDFLLPNMILRALAALAALSLMLAQGMIVYRARGVVTWNTRWMPFFFATAGLMTGTGLILIIVNVVNLLFGRVALEQVSMPLLGIGFALLNLVVWFIYLGTRDGEFQKTIDALKTPSAHAQIVLLGHVVPVLLLASSLPFTPFVYFRMTFEIVAGGALLFGGARQKFGIVLQAGYLRAIALSPARRRGVAQPIAYVNERAKANSPKSRGAHSSETLGRAGGNCEGASVSRER